MPLIFGKWRKPKFMADYYEESRRYYGGPY